MYHLHKVKCVTEISESLGYKSNKKLFPHKVIHDTFEKWGYFLMAKTSCVLKGVKSVVK